MPQIRLSQDDAKFLRDLQNELLTQPNDGNADPVFWGVIETREEPALDDCGEARIYNCDGDCSVMTLDEAVEWVNDNIEDKDLIHLWDTLDHDDFDTVYREGREEWGAEKGKKYLVEVLGRRTTLDGTKLLEG